MTKIEPSGRKSILPDLALLSSEPLALADFGRECIDRLRASIPIDIACLGLLASEGRYERFLSCWPDWAADEYLGKAVSTRTWTVSELRKRPLGLAYPVRGSGIPGEQVILDHSVARIWTAPLVFDGVTYGSFSVGRAHGRFSDDELVLFRAVSEVLTANVRRDAERTRERLNADRAAVMNELAMMVNTGEPVEEFYAKAMPVLRRVLDLDISLIEVLGEEPRTLRVVACDRPEVFAPGEILPHSNEAAERVLDKVGPLLEFRADHLPGDSTPRLADHGFRRAVAAPLQRDGELLGLFVAARHEVWRFSAEEKAFLGLFGALLTQVMVGRRRLEQAAQEADEQRFIAEISAAVAAASVPEELVRALADSFQTLIPDPFLVYGYLEADELVVPAPAGGRRLRLPLGVYMRRALEEGQTVAPAGLAEMSYEGAAIAKAVGVETISFTAAEAGGIRCGLLLVGSRTEGYEFTQRDLRLFRVAARIVGPAMANIRALELAREEAEEERIISEVARAAAGAADPVGLVAALAVPFSQFISDPIVAFGYLEGGELVFPSLGDRARQRFNIDEYALRALDSGQAAAPSGAVAGYGGAAERRRAIDQSDQAGSAEPELTAGDEAWLTAAKSGGLATGILVVESRQPGIRFTQRQLYLFRVLADIIGPAMANVRSAELAREEAEEQRIIAEISAAVAMESTPADLVNAIQRPFGRIIPDAFVRFTYVDEARLEAPSVSREASRYLDAPPEILEVFARGQVRVHAGTMRELIELLGLEAEGARLSAIATVARNGGGVAGILFTGSADAERKPTSRELKLLRLVAQIIGPAMANVRAAEIARIEADEQRLIADVASVAARASTPEALLDGIVEPFRAMVPKPVIGFGYFDGDEVVYPARGGRRRFPKNPDWTDANGQLIRHYHGDAPTPAGGQLDSLGVRVAVYTAVSSAGEMSGILVTGSRVPGHHFSERDLRLFRLVTQIVGPAMANTLAAERAREEAEEQRIIAELAAVAAREPTPESLVEGIVEPFRAIIPSPYVGFGYFDEGGIVFPRRGGRYRGARNLSWTDPLMQIVATYSPDDPTKRADDPLMVRLGVRVITYTSASSAGAMSGVLAAGSRVAGHRFSERDLRIFRVAAQIIGPAMANALAAERAREEAEEQRIIAEVAAAAARESDPAALIAALHGPLGAFVANPSIEVGYAENELMRWAGSDPEERTVLTELEREALASGQAIGRLASLESVSEDADAVSARGIVVTRMASGGELVGALSVVSRGESAAFSERDLRLFRIIAQIIGPAFANARALEAMARENDLHTLIVDSLSEAVLLFNYDLGVVFQNSGGRLLRLAMDPGRRAESVRDIADNLPPEFRKSFFDAAVHGERTRGREHITVDGQERWFDYENIPLEHPEHRLLFVASDVTAEVLRNAEQARHRHQLEQSARLAALGELISGVAHELNNPLTAILGFSEVIADSEIDHPFRDEVDVIRHEAARARNIVRDLLDIARPSPSERTDMKVTDLLAYLDRIRRPVWNRLRIAATVDAGEVASPVWADARQITQVLLNLVTNAEHALEDIPKPRIEVRAAAGPEGEIVITVTDNGVGMDEATAARIFEPFFTTKQGTGTGLGLSLSYSIISSHNGRIEVNSTRGEGTTFTVTLPTSEAAHAIEPNFEDEEGTPRKVRVLVIDDEPNLRKLCQRLITSMGHDCTTADSSESALSLVAEASFDLILCDYRLGAETADTVLAGFARVAPHLVQRTVIATGATTDSGVVELCGRHELRIIAKPYGAEQIAEMVASVA